MPTFYRLPVFKTGAINQTLPNLHLICRRGGIRTYSALRQQIYSLSRLSNFAALADCLMTAEDNGFEPLRRFTDLTR